ncbi:hypothetical protein F183_A18910 [Bryobacterales bacterium F-183]|nr:hypothetical protein F183_A18910 [Bryobacterales bacterium F-183]
MRRAGFIHGANVTLKTLASPSPAPAPKRLLLAEDNPHDRFLLEECFVSASIPVHIDWAPDGQAALDRLLAQTETYNLVILDANLPRKAAHMILEELHAAGRTAGAPVVVLSSMVTGQRKQNLLDLGVRAVLKKPLDLSEYDQLALDLNAIMSAD